MTMGDRPTPQNLGDVFRQAAQIWPDRISHIVPDGRGHKELTFAESWQLVRDRAAKIESLGLRPGDRVVLVGETGIEWSVTDYACQTLGLVTVPIYPTLPPDQTQYIATDCDAKAAFCGSADLAQKLTGVPVVCWTKSEGFKSFDDLGPASSFSDAWWNERIDSVPTTAVATFIYTSGTTGNPKGAMLSHENFIFVCQNIRTSLPVDETDRFLSWLPVSHVFERVAGHILTCYIGASVVYSSVTTMASDMMKFRPSVVTCVPRLLESLRGRVVDNAKKESPLKQKIFALALSQGLTHQRGGFAPFFAVTDKLVGQKIRARTGGNIKFFVSGGAALAPPVAEFFMAFGLTVLQGYGLTETTAASSLNPPDDNDPDTVGPPIQGVEIKLATDGEILIRGKSVMLGYHNLPEATKEAIDQEGWFHTGDIGEWSGKHIKITDRKKDILVLGNGKNVAPQHVENKVKESEFVGEVVLLGDGMEHCCALVVPDFERVRAWLKAQGVEEPDDAALVARDDVKKLIKGEIDAANKLMADFEKVKRHTLVARAFSVETGELTPSLKVRRKVVKENYASEIEGMRK